MELTVIARHRAGRSLCITEENRLHHEIAIDGVGDCLPDLQVGQFLAAMVDLHHKLIGQRLISFGNDLKPRHFRNTVEIGKRHGGKSCKIDFLGFQRSRRRSAIRQDAIDDLVEIRLTFAPVIGIFLKAIIFARLVPGIFERAGADELFIGRIGHDIRPGKYMFRQHRRQRGQGIADELERRRRGKMEDCRMLVRCFDLFQRLEHDPAKVLQRLPDFHGRKGYIGGSERRSVVPFDTLAQTERRRQPIAGAFPPRGEAGNKTVLALEGRLGQRLDHLACHEEYAVRCDDSRIEIARFRIRRHDQPSALSRLVSRFRTLRPDSKGSQRGSPRQKNLRERTSRAISLPRDHVAVR